MTTLFNKYFHLAIYLIAILVLCRCGFVSFDKKEDQSLLHIGSIAELSGKFSIQGSGNITAGQCAVFNLELNPSIQVDSDLSVHLELFNTSQEPLNIYKDAVCTQASNAVVIPKGVYRRSFYVKQNISGHYYFLTTPDVLLAVVKNVMVHAASPKVVELEGNSIIPVSQCQTYQVSLKDSFGNLVELEESFRLNIQSQGGGKLKVGTQCSNTDSDIFADIAPGQSQISLSYYNSTVQKVTLVVTGNGLNTEQQDVYSVDSGANDPLFNSGQSIYSDYLNASEMGEQVVSGPDGSAYVIGHRIDQGRFKLLLIKVLSNGQLDNNFGENGRVIYAQSSSSSDKGVGIAIQHLQNGISKIVVLASTNEPSAGFYLTRFQMNGQMDLSFGLNGIKSPSKVSGELLYANRLTLLEEGHILVSGQSVGADQDAKVYVSKFDPQGIEDLSFGTSNGALRLNLKNLSDEGVFDLKIQLDQKLVLAGYVKNQVDSDMMVLRLNPNGSKDLSFGTDGVVVVDVQKTRDIATRLEIQHSSGEEKIIVGGQSVLGVIQQMTVLRLHSNGLVDTTFNANQGKFSFSLAPNLFSSLGDMKLMDDGRILLGGYVQASSEGNDAVVVRLLASGVRDTSFAESGVRNLSSNQLNDEVRGIELTPDGKIVSVGFMTQSNLRKRDVAVSRLLP